MLYAVNVSYIDETKDAKTGNVCNTEMLECFLRSASRRASYVRPRLRRKTYTPKFVGEISFDNLKSIQIA